ncbi:MAG: PQQ-dependent sugar dehydrogenase [Acidobacteriia bacterium]|nr:PQQ-dependent sugar dehydrogenase [Terriglobia bacterium]
MNKPLFGLFITLSLMGVIFIHADRNFGETAGAGPVLAPLQLVPVLTGLSNPLFVTSSQDGSNRLFVVEQGGRIKVLQPGASSPSVFLDISSKEVFGGEQGLLGLAFHPQFFTNRRFFVDYTRAGDGATVIAEYHASVSDANVADPVEKILLIIAQPFVNHNGGMVAFGPDGFLYIGMGDGGSGNDPGNRAQNTNELLGKILRIDVDHPNGSVPYSSPPGNPFFSGGGRSEIFSVGMRNPFRFSFDRGTGQLFVGDVGQDHWEEVDIVTIGGNYGWRIFEGNHCTNNDPALCANTSGFTFPIAEYPHAQTSPAVASRCSITGGYVYRGTRGSLPAGVYLFADFCSGEIVMLNSGTQTVLLNSGLNISSFGEDEAGEIYVAGLGGQVSRLVSGNLGCGYSISPATQSFNSGGGTGTVAVSAASGCTWSAASSVSWINVTSGGSGSGNGTVSYSVATNSQGLSRVGTLSVAGQVFAITQDVTNGGNTQVNLTVPSGGAASTTTTGQGNLVHAGYATVTTSPTNAVSGTAVFSLRQNNVIVSEAGVPISPPTTTARMFIDFRTGVPAKDDREGIGTIGVNTGIALVNPGGTTANVQFRLRDANGNELAVGNGVIPPEAHRAVFITELNGLAPDFNLPPNFSSASQFGSLDISSVQPLSIVALRLTTNQRGETLLTTTPIADLTLPGPSSQTFFPHFADGNGNQTSVILLNTSNNPETGVLKFFNNGGDSQAIRRVGDVSPTDSFRYSIPPGGLFRLASDGSPASAVTGSVQLTPDNGSSTPIGAGILSLSQNGVLVSETGIPSATPTSHARIYVDKSGGHDTGVAIAAPGNSAVTVTFRAFQADGSTPAGTGAMSLNSNGHDAKFAGQVVPGLPDSFTGVVDLSSVTPFVALTLRSLTNSRNEFLMSTFPVADVLQTPSAPIVFPQVADGGGYQTQFILLEIGAPTSATLKFFADNGTPLAIGKFALPR